MATIKIRNVSDEDYQALRDAAKLADKSIEAYVLQGILERAKRAQRREADLTDDEVV